MADATPPAVLSHVDANRLRLLLAPLFASLNNQGGGCEIEIPMTVANLRKIRRTLYPMSPRLAAVSGLNSSPETESERRALRAAEYPEPAGPR